MPRFLWLGLVVCVAVLVGALALMGDHDPREELAASTSAHVDTVDRPGVELALAPSTGPSERSTVAAPPSEATDSRAPDPGAATRLSDVGYHGPDEPVPHDGVLEIRVVRDEDNGPIEGAIVTIEATEKSESVLTDAMGSAVFNSVAVSWWGLRVSAVTPGRPPISSPVFIDPESRRAAVELRPFIEREVLVRIVDPLGLPFRPADWQIARAESQRLGIVLAGACGRIGELLDIGGAPTHRTRSAGPDAGAYAWVVVIRGRAQACVHAVLGDTVVGAAELDASATELEVRIDADALASAISPIVVRVVDAIRGTAIEGAQVRFPGGSGAKRDLRTDANGRVDAGFSVAGSFDVSVSARGYAPQSSSIARPIPAEIVVRLQPGRVVTGRVVDQDGAPIADATILVEGEGADGVDGIRASTDGTFALEDLPASELVVRAIHRPSGPHGAAVTASAKADCRERDVLGLEVKLNLPRAVAPKPR